MRGSVDKNGLHHAEDADGKEASQPTLGVEQAGTGQHAVKGLQELDHAVVEHMEAPIRVCVVEDGMRR